MVSMIRIKKLLDESKISREMGIHKKHIFDQEKNKEAHFQPKIKERKHQDKKRNQDLDHAIDQKKSNF